MYKAGKEIDLEYIQMLYHCKKYNELFEIIKEPVKVKDDEKYADYDYIHYFILSLNKKKNYNCFSCNQRLRRAGTVDRTCILWQSNRWQNTNNKHHHQ